VKSVSTPDIKKWKDHELFQLLLRAMEKDERDCVHELHNACSTSTDPNVRDAYGRWQYLHNAVKRAKDPK
jgi:hypothetical protein